MKISAKRLRDSQKQEEVIKMYSKELSEAIISELMISHLRKIGLLTREEEQIVERKGSDTKQNLEIFHLMKNKAGWWEALIEYLVIYKAIYLKDQLIETLKSEA